VRVRADRDRRRARHPSAGGVITRWHVRGTGSLALRVFRGTLKANYSKTTLDPFPQNAWDTTTYSCTGTQSFTASRVG
jgi:hypothetical protein